MFLEFEEEGHTYYIPGSPKEFISVTELLGKYKQPFKTVEVAKAYAEKHGHTPQYWIDKWTEKKDLACDRGSKYHKMKEDLVYNCGIDSKEGKLYQAVNWELRLRSLPNHWLLPDGVYLELRVWLMRYGISGSIDKVYITTGENGVRYVDIEDYKTNESLDFRSFYNRKTGERKMMKYPIGHLEDCNWNHYQLQLSMYAYILEHYGFTVRSLTVQYQGHEPFEGLGEPDLKPYLCEYLREDVKRIMNTRL